MGTNLEALKQNLNFRISRIDKEESLREIEKTVEIVEHYPTKKQSEMLKKLAKPMRKKMTIDELIKEQNWKPIDRAEFDRLVKELDIQEPLEDLIADIGK
jgi:hypothetical protein